MTNSTNKVLAVTAIAASLFAYLPAYASPSAAREVCKQFIEKSSYSVQDWGESWNWTAIDNKDGTWSVGAKFIGMPPGGGTKNLYVTCIAQKNGDNWKLVKLSRMY